MNASSACIFTTFILLTFWQDSWAWPWTARIHTLVSERSEPSESLSSLGQQWQQEIVEKAAMMENSTQALQLLVKAASKEQKTRGIQEPVIMITIANDEGVNSLLPMFVETLNEVAPMLASSAIVIAVNTPAFEGCRQHQILCFHDREAEARNKDMAETAASATLPRNKTPQFLQIGWDKLKRLQEALEVNTTVLFADTDIVWLQDPLPHLQKSAVDLQLTHDGWGPNIGVMFVRPTECTSLFMEEWLARRSVPDARDQYEFPAAVQSAQSKCQAFKVEHLEKPRFPNGCCCGYSYPPKRGDAQKWVMWHAACGGDLDSKKSHMNRILEASRGSSCSQGSKGGSSSQRVAGC